AAWARDHWSAVNGSEASESVRRCTAESSPTAMVTRGTRPDSPHQRSPTGCTRQRAGDASESSAAAPGWVDRGTLRRQRARPDWEPLDTWRRFASDAKAILACASSLRSGELGNQADWERIAGGRVSGILDARTYHGLAVRRWIGMGRVQ